MTAKNASADAATPTIRGGKYYITLIVASMMLFSMYFGAGNLIFPPMLGAHAGEAFTPAIIGFLLAGVLLPVISVIAVAVTGDSITDMSNRGGKVFGIVFPILVYLSIGALYAVPRTAVVSYGSGFVPISGVDNKASLVIYCIVFFVISAALAWNSNSIIDNLGKFLTPALLFLLAVMIIMSFVRLDSQALPPAEDYAAPMSAGLIQGYATMDSLAALAFGILVVTSLRYKRVGEGPRLVRSVSAAAIGAGILLALVYIGLGIIGKNLADGRSYKDGASLLAASAHEIMGTPGMYALGAIVFLACLTTSVGLIGSTSEFFNEIAPGISYHAWVIIFSVIALGISSLGLTAVRSGAAPIIGFLYPAAMTLVLITLVEPLFGRKLFWTYRISLYVAIIWAGLMSLNSLGWGSAVIEPLISWAPGHSNDLGWWLPVLTAAIVGLILDFTTRKKEDIQVGVATLHEDEPVEAAVTA